MAISASARQPGALRARFERLRPTTAWRVWTSIAYSGVIALLLVGAAAWLFGVKPSSTDVATVSATAVGDCVSVTDGRAAPSDCDNPAMNFLVAQKVPAKTACALPSYARVDTEGETLCVVPNLALGNCYRVKPDSSATTDIRRIDCPAPLGVSTPDVIRVTQRSVGAPLSCRGGYALNYTAPQRLGYCIVPVS